MTRAQKPKSESFTCVTEEGRGRGKRRPGEKGERKGREERGRRGGKGGRGEGEGRGKRGGKKEEGIQRGNHIHDITDDITMM